MQKSTYIRLATEAIFILHGYVWDASHCYTLGRGLLFGLFSILSGVQLYLMLQAMLACGTTLDIWKKNN